MIKLADINGCSAVGLLVMMYPILCKVQYESLHQLLTKRDLWKQIGFSVIVNWIIAPHLPAWAFVGISPGQEPSPNRPHPRGSG